MTRLLYESHMHTPLCKHSRGEPEEYAAVAERKNLRGIIVTCHNPMPDGYSASVRMSEAEFPRYVEIVARAREAWAGRVDVRLGLECDFVPGYEGYVEKQIGSAALHHVLGSVHPQVGEYRRRYWTGDVLAFERTYFEHIALAAESRLFDTISHPDLVKNMHPADWNLELVWGDILRCLDRVAKTGAAMELNTSGLNKEIPEMNPGPAILREMAVRGIPVVIGADAHDPERVAANYVDALDLLSAAGHTHVHFYLDRKRQAVAIAEARASLAG